MVGISRVASKGNKLLHIDNESRSQQPAIMAYVVEQALGGTIAIDSQLLRPSNTSVAYYNEKPYTYIYIHSG